MNKFLIVTLLLTSLTPAFASEAKREKFAEQKRVAEDIKAEKRKTAALVWYTKEIGDKRVLNMPAHK